MGRSIHSSVTNDFKMLLHLDGAPVAGLRRIGDNLTAITRAGAPAWGKAGEALGEFVLAYCEWAEQEENKSQARTEKKKEKEAAKDKADENTWEIEFLKAFYDTSIRACGTADQAWGRDRKLIRRANETHHTLSPEQLTGLIEPFFRCKDHEWPSVRMIFGKGSVLSFTQNLVRLVEYQLKANPAKPDTPAIPKVVTA